MEDVLASIVGAITAVVLIGVMLWLHMQFGFPLVPMLMGSYVIAMSNGAKYAMRKAR